MTNESMPHVRVLRCVHEPHSHNQTIKVSYFAAVADILGVRTDELTSAEPIRVRDITRLIRDKYPTRLSAAHATLLDRCAICVNMEYVDMDDPRDQNLECRSGDQVAIIPPVSGG